MFEPDKVVGSVHLRFREVPDSWIALSGVEFDGYDIRHGRTIPSGSDPSTMTEVLPNHAGFVSGNVLGIATHGLLENSTALTALFGVAPQETLDDAIDRIADTVEEHLDIAAIDQLVDVS